MTMNVVIAGGGTGGHLFVGIALAEELIARDPETHILFIGTKREMETTALSKKGFPLKRIAAEGIKGRGICRRIRSVAKIPWGIIESGFFLWQFKTDIVIGVGGYSSGPVAIAALFMRIHIVIHEQNLVPGLTNRLLGRFADRIFVSFAESVRHFDPQRTLFTGNPVRREILSGKVLTADPKHFTVLVVGGSQGAHRINKVVVDALQVLNRVPGIFFIHQTGQKDAPWVTGAYRELGRNDQVKPFFDDMGTIYGSANLVVCRAGATTVAEITVLGKAAIFIPFPFATDNHQELNARGLAEQGAAELIREVDLNGKALAERILYYKEHREELKAMGEKAGSFGRPDAAKEIVTEILDLGITELRN
jgi:UDP-N-acetylglucosamine--N-acetylmuramyl-(pentapeptide) pyrophosphoryl-undecaprenol N-acetylglucosamine transferase